MKKITSFLIACLMFIFTAIAIYNGVGLQAEKAVKIVDNNLNYFSGLEKLNNPEILGNVIDENTVVLLGSSELPYYDEISHPMIITNYGNADFNIMMLGVGYIQSLQHTINAGGLEPYIENRKVVLNLSPQWFTQEGVNPDAFSSRFSPRMLNAFMENNKISNELKQKVLERCEELFSSYPDGLEMLSRYEDELNGGIHNPIDKIKFWITDKIDKMKAERDLIEILPEYKLGTESFINFDEIDFDALLAESTIQGETECTNNDFYIYNDYFDTYIKPSLEEYKDSYATMSYSVSPEYDDLKLFLDVCKELDLEVMLINTPVNGFWYDYAGFPQERREEYYQNIRDIAEEYDVEILDLSVHEYTPYFLKDIMHMGWKGWVYIDEGIYSFYKKNISK